MNWKRYGQWQLGNAVVVIKGEDHVFRFDLGVVTTGRQRVFHRYYVRIRLSDGTTLSGEDEYGLRAALFNLDRQMQEREMILLAVGLESEWSESEISFNSAYGYITHCDRAVNMMDMPPPRDRNPDDGQSVDAMIREAVNGMSFGRPAIGPLGKSKQALDRPFEPNTPTCLKPTHYGQHHPNGSKITLHSGNEILPICRNGRDHPISEQLSVSIFSSR